MSSQDLDRRLTDFLADGPSRAPDRTVEAAIAHARAHPRRPDPLHALRRDPMGTAWFGGSPVARGLLVVAVLGALLAASVAVAAVGGLLGRQAPSVVVPAPTPSAPPDGAPSAAPRTVLVDLAEAYGNDATIEVADLSGRLVEARSGEPAEGGSVEPGVVRVDAGEHPNEVTLTWTGGTCETRHDLDIERDGRTVFIDPPECEGDAMPRDLVLVLRFDAAVDPADLSVILSPATQP